jgi:hypothetical protein
VEAEAQAQTQRARPRDTDTKMIFISQFPARIEAIALSSWSTRFAFSTNRHSSSALPWQSLAMEAFSFKCVGSCNRYNQSKDVLIAMQHSKHNQSTFSNFLLSARIASAHHETFESEFAIVACTDNALTKLSLELNYFLCCSAVISLLAPFLDSATCTTKRKWCIRQMQRITKHLGQPSL